MKRLLAIIVTIGLVTTLLPQATFAASSQQKLCALYDACWYDAGSTCLISGPGGSGPLYGPAFPKVGDTKDLVSRITDFIKNSYPDTGMLANVNDMVSLGEKYNVNPALLVAVAAKETGMGTDGGIGDPPQHNFWGARGSGDSWQSFPTYKASIEEYYQNLRTNSAYAAAWAKGNTASVDDIIYVASPPSENDTGGYVKQVHEMMQKMLGGVSTDGSRNDIAPVSSCGAGSTSAGALGWDLSGAHAMVSYNQGDTQWAGLPYGAGKTSIGSSGCGPTSMAMIAATLTGDHSITPKTIADRYGASYHVSEGTSWGVFPVFGADYGLKMTDLGTNLQAAANIIRQGGLVIISVDPGYFTGGGHLMVIRAVSADGSGFYLADPNGNGRHGDSETRAFTAEFLAGDGNLKNLWGYTK